MTTTDRIIDSIRAQAAHLFAMREFVERHRAAFDTLEDQFSGPLEHLPDLFIHRCPDPKQFAKAIGGKWQRDGGNHKTIDWVGVIRIGEQDLRIHLFAAETRDNSEIVL